jgi:hypothetical protein
VKCPKCPNDLSPTVDTHHSHDTAVSSLEEYPKVCAATTSLTY